MYLPIKILSETGKQIEIVEALLDSGASGKFIDQDYTQKIHAERKNLKRPIQVYNMDGTPNKKGTITQYVELELEIHERKRKHQLLVTGLGNQQIILGFTWLKEMNPIIDWKENLGMEKIETLCTEKTTRRLKNNQILCFCSERPRKNHPRRGTS